MMQPTPAPSTPPRSPPPDDPMELEEASGSQVAYPIPPQNVGSAPFGVLVGLFEKLQVERKQEKRRKLLASWFGHWREEVGNDLYPVLRLILPQKDRERAVYNLKEKTIAKIYIKLIGLRNNDPAAQRLTNWKKPTERNTTSGDFPSVLHEVVSSRFSSAEGELSIEDVNEYLDEISKCGGKQEKQLEVLTRIYNRTTPDEQKWIIRIILKDMVISVKETTVFSVFHPDAQDLYNACSDLKKVAWTLWDVTNKLDEDQKTVSLFQPFAPMLCKRPTKTIDQTVKEMGGVEFLIEEKLDGERMQLHKRGNEYYYCSRKGKDYTYMYGKHVGTGSLTPYLHKAFHPAVENCILDGEMLVWDPVSERNLPFGSLKTAALGKDKSEITARPYFKVFDLLYLNNTSLLDRTTAFRKKNLRHCLTDVKGRVECATESKGKTAKDVRAKMEEVMEARGEGLVIKHPKSKYILNGRNMDWVKVKPEYMDNMGETVDVLVVGGNYGSGSRGGGVSTFICAVYDDRDGDPLDDDDRKYSTFVRIGTGLTYIDYQWIRELPWKPWDKKNPPEFLQTSKKSSNEDKGDVYLEPAHSFILKVKAAEIVTSEMYHFGYTMRFPRATAIRRDLDVDDCMSWTKLLDSIRSDNKRKMDDTGGEAKKKRKITAKKATILPSYQGPKRSEVEVESEIFEGQKFVVVPDPKSKTGSVDKNTLVSSILANGGKCMQIATNKDPAYNIKLIIDKGVHDIIKPQWVTDSIASGKRASLNKKYFFHATASRVETEEYDEGAESVTEDEDEEEARPTPMNVDSKNEDEPQDTESDEDRNTETVPKLPDMDPRLAEWFKEDDGKYVPGPPESVSGDISETESENDSDNDDTMDDEPEVKEEDIDDMFEAKEEEVDVEAASDGPAEESESIKMGEDDSAMEYDQEKIFKHLCFYLDSPANVDRHGMATKAKQAKEITESFEELEKLITDNGGRVVNDLTETKLTHVVVDKRDTSRRLELIKRTSQPKRRHLVISEYIQACMDEETLLDEDDFVP